jgi:hypothetical protein
VKMLFLLQFFYSTVTSMSWLTCWKWTAMMTLHFRQQNCVDGDGSWWQFLWPFLWFWFVHSTGILCRTGTKHEISVWKSRENPLEKILSIVISFVVSSLGRMISQSYGYCRKVWGILQQFYMCMTACRASWFP